MNVQTMWCVFLLKIMIQKRCGGHGNHWLCSFDYCICRACAEQPHTKEGLKTINIVWNVYKRGGPKTQEQKPKLHEKDLKIDPSGLEIGKPRERVQNLKGNIFRPFHRVKTIGNFSFHFTAPKCMVGMTLNLFFIEFVDHVIHKSLWKGLVHMVDLPPIAMECGFMRTLCIWRFGNFIFWNLANLGHFFLMGNPLYRLKL
jgi:hypothetical protein